MKDLELDIELVFEVLEAGLSLEKNLESHDKLDTYATQELIRFLQEANTDQIERLAAIEWGFLAILGRHHSTTGPETLFNEIKNDAQWYVDLLIIVYREENDDSEHRVLSEMEKNKWKNAHDLLDAFSAIPGTQEDGSLDETVLSQWTSNIRDLAEKANRLGVADYYLGRLFSKCPWKDASEDNNDEEQNSEVTHDKSYSFSEEQLDWPSKPVRQVMEQIGSDRLFEGFVIGVSNRQSFTTRGPYDGGEIERRKAARYNALADKHQSDCPHLAQTFRNLATDYEHRAAREDQDAERRRLER